jgi:RNA polymerase sigma factor (sigma-70 family)
MKVFLSWSGTKSREVAVALRGWLPSVINSLEPFVSSRDINAGTRWQSEIATQLDDSNFGIVCVTRDNQMAPWLNFEAGALAKALGLSRLIPLAVDLTPSDIELPLGQFQAQEATKEGIQAVVVSLNDALGDDRLSDELLQKSFEKWWPELEEQLKAIQEQTTGDAPPVRTDRELLEETLDTVRAVARVVEQIGLGPTAEDRFMSLLRRDSVARALDALPSRERQVIALRFGLDNEDPKTLAEIGKLLDLSIARVRQVEAEALGRLAGLRQADFATEPDDKTR